MMLRRIGAMYSAGHMLSEADDMAQAGMPIG